MKIVLFGGSFNPVHNGHIEVAGYLSNLKRFDRIIIMPCFISPLKQSLLMAPTFHRMEMLRLAFSSMDNVTLSDYEVSREEVSYTINTVEYLKQSAAEVSVAMGLDNYLSLHRWHRIDELKKFVSFLVLNRLVDAVKPPEKIPDLKVEFLDSPWVDASSTEIRERMLKNESLQGLVPHSILEYIYKHKLYQL